MVSIHRRESPRLRPRLSTSNGTTCSGKGFGGPNPPRVLLSEMASCQLEFRYLAHMTGRAEYYWAVERVNGVLQMSQNMRGDSLWSTQWETENGTQMDGERDCSEFGLSVLCSMQTTCQ